VLDAGSSAIPTTGSDAQSSIDGGASAAPLSESAQGGCEMAPGRASGGTEGILLLALLLASARALRKSVGGRTSGDFFRASLVAIGLFACGGQTAASGRSETVSCSARRDSTARQFSWRDEYETRMEDAG
jgi:hypothetical protein